jgi:hypothetical protein
MEIPDQTFSPMAKRRRLKSQPQPATSVFRPRLHWQIPHSLAVFCGLFASSLGFLLLSPYYTFAAKGFLDTWVYTGYFTNFSYLLRHYGLTYYVSRLPWIIPGLLAYQVWPPVVANILLQALVVTVTAASLFWVIRWYYGSTPALLACIALITNLYFIYTIAWEYPDAPATAYASVAAAFLLRPHGRRAVNNLVAGATVALSLLTNLAGTALCAALLLIPCWRRGRSPRKLLVEGAWMLIGMVACFGLYCLVSQGMLGHYDAFWVHIKQGLSMSGRLEAMWGSGFDWIPRAYRLSLPLFLIGIGAVLQCLRKTTALVLPAYLFLTVTFALFTFQDAVLHMVALRVSYHSSYMLLPAMLFAGVVFGELWKLFQAGRIPPANGHGRKAALLGSLPALPLAACGLVLPWLFSHRVRESIALIWTLVAVLAILAMLALLLSIRRPAFAWAGCLLVLLAVHVGPALDRGLEYPFLVENAYMFHSAMDVQAFLKSAVDPERPVRFWFEPVLPDTPVFDSVSSLYLWGYCDFTKLFRTSSPDTIRERLPPTTTLINLTSNAGALDARKQLLASRGIRVANERMKTILFGSSRFFVILEDVADMSALR